MRCSNNFPLAVAVCLLIVSLTGFLKPDSVHGQLPDRIESPVPDSQPTKVIAKSTDDGVRNTTGETSPTGNAPLASRNSKSGQELKVLLVAGGCCHDYASQTKILKEGIEKRIRAKVTVVYNPDTKTTATFKIYEKDDWAKGYDVVIHDECCANVTEGEYVKRILAAHRSGVPAVNLHCAMHSYRWGDFRKPVSQDANNAGWFEMLGVQSSGHGPKLPVDIKYAETENPIVKGLKDWKTVDEELYNNVRVFGSAEVLASGTQVQKPNARQLKKNPNAKEKIANAVVVWTNLYGPKKTRIFSTSLGHFNETVADDRYMELVVRGLLWSTHNLTDDAKPIQSLRK